MQLEAKQNNKQGVMQPQWCPASHIPHMLDPNNHFKHPAVPVVLGASQTRQTTLESGPATGPNAWQEWGQILPVTERATCRTLRAMGKRAAAVG